MNSKPVTSITPSAILQLGSAFWGSKTLLSAVGMGLFTELAKEPLDAEALRLRLGLQERGAKDFFDALVSLGMLDRVDGRYANTPATDLYLDRNKSSYIGAWLEMADRRLFRIWDSLTTALQTGKPQNEFGEDDPFNAMYSNDETLESFVNEMTAVSAPVVKDIINFFSWEKYHSFIDIGTVRGGVPVMIARAHTHLTGGGFDLPQVKPMFDRYVSGVGLADRLKFYPGDFHTQPLPSADVLIMGHILVDWDNSVKQKLLTKAYEALPKGGALIVYDMVIDDDRRQNTMGLLMSLNMLLETTGGCEYTGAECTSWMRNIGFSEISITPIAASHSMIVGIK